MEQKSVFLSGEGDAYFRRNAQTNALNHAKALEDHQYDPVIRALVELKPHRILEVGASNGWRLDVARLHWGARCHGIEPSREAVYEGRQRYPDIFLEVGTADKLPERQFDCIVFGFCLYLCDRADLFRVASEADRVLVPGGYLVVQDFFPSAPYRNPYAHKPGVFSHKMDHTRLWSWHPAYTLWRHDVMAHDGKSPDDPDERLAVTVLKKH